MDDFRCSTIAQGVPSAGSGLRPLLILMASPTFRPRNCPHGQGSTFDVSSASAFADCLARDRPVAGRVLTICAEDMDQWLGVTVNDRPLWLVDGSGTVKERGPIQCGLVLYERGALLRTHSAAFMPGGGLLGTWKLERFLRGGDRVKRKMEISSSAVEELCLAWALDFHIGHFEHDWALDPCIVVDNLHWLPALCGIADPSPTTIYSRSVLAECICRQGGCFLLRHAVPCMDKEVWGRRKHHTSWPADQAALMANLDHRLVAPAMAFGETRDAHGPRGPRPAGVHGDIHPRAWGQHVDIVRLVHTGQGTYPGNYCPGDLLGVYVRVVDHYPGHRGSWLESLTPSLTGGPRQHVETELATMTEVLHMRYRFPPTVSDTRRTAQIGHAPAPCALFFDDTTAPEEAEYNRAKARPRGVAFGTFHTRPHKECAMVPTSSRGPFWLGPAGDGVGLETRAAEASSAPRRPRVVPTVVTMRWAPAPPQLDPSSSLGADDGRRPPRFAY